MFKYGIDTALWTLNFGKEHVEKIKKIKDMGFEAIDIFIADPDNFPVTEVMENIKEYDLELIITSALSKDTNIIDPLKEIRNQGVKYIKKLVDLAVKLDSKLIGGLLYAAWAYFTGKPRTEKEWNYSIESFRIAAEYAKQKDVVLAIEPVRGAETHFLNNAKDAVKYCKDVGTGNVKVHLDTFHMIREETNFSEAVESCGEKYLGYIHLNENNRDIPGTGLVPWFELFKVIKNVNYKGILTFEFFNQELNYISKNWRSYKYTGEEMAKEGLKRLKKIENEV
jgi:D-psicose/D-tagatose/L-ribulose 3-epimerase